MSRSNNFGPFKSNPNSQSRHSLYTDHSDDSDVNPMHQQIQKQHVEIKNTQTNIPVQKETPKQQQNSHLPKLYKNEAKDKIKIQNSKPTKNDQFRLPVSNLQQDTPRVSLYNPHRGDGFGFKQFQKSYTQNVRRYGFNDSHNQSGFPEQNTDQKQRMLRSSQGGRWLRSLSLVSQKQQKAPQNILKSYHRHGSVMGETVSRCINHYLRYQKQFINKPFKLSLFMPLQAIKNKMESYLQKKLQMENMPIDKPGPNWHQQQLTNFFTNYQPLYRQVGEDLTKMKGITLKKYKNCVYFGSMLNGKKNGIGVLHYYGGRFFEGFFQDDYKIEGLQISDNELYLGTFKKGLRCGSGILKTDEYLLVGEFQDGQFGIKSYQEMKKSTMGSTMNGSLKYKKNGFKLDYELATFYENDLVITKNNIGDIFIGNINEKNEKNGQGLQIFANGDLYVGKYQSGTPEGYGEYYWGNGALYRGQFLSGMRHGKGKWQMINADSYQGQYMNDKKNGKGTYIWKNGVKYIGSFENDYRHGYGQMYWQDGKVYKGQWINGIEANKSIKLQPKGLTQKGGSNLSNRNNYRTLQHSSLNKRKVPLQKLKSIYNPSNNFN